MLKIDQRGFSFLITYVFYSDTWDEHIPFSAISQRIAPRHTYTYHENGDFQRGQRVEFKDDASLWREAFIEEVAPNSVAVRMRTDRNAAWISKSAGRIRRFGLSKSLQRKASKRWSVPGAISFIPDTKGLSSSSSSSSSSSTETSRRRCIGAASADFSRYSEALRAYKLTIVAMSGDGNCLFRSVAHQVYGDESLHGIVREKCCDYMATEKHFYANFVVGGMAFFDRYIAAKRADACWGDDPEIQAMCELYNRPAEIWAFDRQVGARKLRTFHDNLQQGVAMGPPMRLSYYGGGHYDSVCGSDFSDIANLLKVPPGQYEDDIISHRRMSQSTEWSDETATLAAGLRGSREEATSWGNEDLQSCLALSLQEAVDEEVSQNKRALSESKAEDDIATTQAQVLRSVEQMSENEYFEQALAESVAGQHEDAVQTQVHENANMSEEAALEIALQQSMQDQQQLQAPYDAVPSYLEDEDDMLQAALFASARQN